MVSGRMRTHEQAKKAQATLERIRRSPERAQRIADEDAFRRRPEGNFHIAESYLVNALRLRQFKQMGHTDHGVRLMYYTALKIYLKAFLRLNGVSPRELARNLGHRYCCLLEHAGKFGLTLSDEDNAVFYALSTRTSVSAFGTLKLARLTGCPSMRLTAPVRAYER